MPLSNKESKVQCRLFEVLKCQRAEIKIRNFVKSQASRCSNKMCHFNKCLQQSNEAIFQVSFFISSAKFLICQENVLAGAFV